MRGGAGFIQWEGGCVVLEAHGDWRRTGGRRGGTGDGGGEGRSVAQTHCN